MGNNIDALQLLKQCEKELLDCGATPLGQTHAKKIISRFKSQIAAFEIPELAPKMERAFLQVLGFHTLAWDDKPVKEAGMALVAASLPLAISCEK
jgi:hypothetical protein